MDRAEWNERMFDFMLKLACEDVVNDELKELDAAVAADPITPSKEFEKRMSKLIRKHTWRLSAKKVIRQAGRVASIVFIIVGVFMSFMLSAQAVREQVANTLVEWGEGFVGFRFSGGQTSADSLLRPTYIPDGFVEGQAVSISGGTKIEYVNGDQWLIRYERYAKGERTSIQIDNEHSVERNETINGYLVQIYDSTEFREIDPSQIVWETEEEFFKLYGNYPVDELYKMAVSIINQLPKQE